MALSKHCARRAYRNSLNKQCFYLDSVLINIMQSVLSQLKHFICLNFIFVLLPLYIIYLPMVDKSDALSFSPELSFLIGEF
jgi:hypothetical protein